jgi:hypothetical protein
MSDTPSTRRDLLRTSGAAAVGLLAGAASVAAATDRPDEARTDSDRRDDCDTEPPVPVHEIRPARSYGDGYVVQAGDIVTLDATGSYDADGEIVEYEWSLPDGRRTGPLVDHYWRETGRKDVSLTVVDDDGASVTTDIYVYVYMRI